MLLQYFRKQKNKLFKNFYNKNNAPVPRPKADIFLQALYAIRDYGYQTTIHGLDRILAKRVGLKQRLLWALVFCLAVWVLITVSTILSTRYNKKQIHTVIESTNGAIYRVPFPEVVICNFNRFNWSRFPEAQKLYLREEHLKEPYISIFEQTVALFDTLSYGKFNRFKALTQLSTSLRELDYVNITDLTNFLSWRCDEVLIDCSWQRQSINCCDVFMTRPSQEGICLSFNNVVTAAGKAKNALDAKWPWRTGAYGARSALKFKLILHEEHHYPNQSNTKGASFQIIEPQVWHGEHINALANTQNTVAMAVVEHFFDNYTRRLTTSERNCIFKDEANNKDYKTLNGLSYMKENCMALCQQQHMVKFCNCSLDMFYPSIDLPSCKFKDLICLAEFNDMLRTINVPGQEKYIRNVSPGMHCNCLLNCVSLTYVLDHRPVPLSTDENLSNFTSMIIYDFYYKNDFYLIFRSSLIYTWVDLLVSFGGISALFLGCSLISLLELSYLLFFRLPYWCIKTTKPIHVKRRKSQDCANNLLAELK